MPSKIRKYDHPTYIQILPLNERKFRNAFFYLERLMQLDPEFEKKMKEIRNKHSSGNITGKQSSREIGKAVAEAIQRNY